MVPPRSLLFRVPCLFAAIICVAGAVRAETIRVFLVSGQSNADGRANITGATQPLSSTLASPQNDVPIYYGTSASTPTGGNYPFANNGTLTVLQPGLSYSSSQFGPEVSFGRSMADYYAAKGESIALIKYAVGGTSLAVDWVSGGTGTTSGDTGCYLNFQTIVTKGLAALKAAHPTATISLSGMIWMQGESDAVAARSGSYQTNLTNFLTDIRLTYGTNLPFVIGQLSTKQTNLTATYLDAVRAAQSAVAATNLLNGLVSTETFTLNSDNLHFNRPGQVDLGNAFAAAMQELLPKVPAVTPTPTPAAKAPNPPSVTGKTTIRTKASKVKVKGTVDGQDYYVQYRLGSSGAFRKASGKAKWKITVRPKLGRNILFLRTKDPASNLTSRLKRVTIIRR